VVFAKSLIAKAPQVPAAPPIQPQAIPPVSYYQPQPQPQQSTGLGQSIIWGAGTMIGGLLVLMLFVVFVVRSCVLGVASGISNAQRQAAERQSSSAQNTKAPAPIKSGMTKREVDALLGPPIREVERRVIADSTFVDYKYKGWAIGFDNDRVYVAVQVQN
jgi:hypothetical protein